MTTTTTTEEEEEEEEEGEYRLCFCVYLKSRQVFRWKCTERKQEASSHGTPLRHYI